MKTTYYVTLPDGRIKKRATARRYTHAVVIRPTFSALYLTQHAWEREHHHGKWLVAGFCGTPELADKLATKERRFYASIGARVEVELLATSEDS